MFLRTRQGKNLPCVPISSPHSLNVWNIAGETQHRDVFSLIHFAAAVLKTYKTWPNCKATRIILFGRWLVRAWKIIHSWKAGLIPDISTPTAIIIIQGSSIFCCNFSVFLFFQYQNGDLRKERFFPNAHATSSTTWGVETSMRQKCTTMKSIMKAETYSWLRFWTIV